MRDAIAATLHSYKSLATRKQLQITLEVPQEYAAEALKMLGVGDPAESQWFALTRLKSGPGSTKEASAPSPPSVAEGQEKPRKHFSDLPRSQQAALKCADNEFCAWLYDGYRELVMQLEKRGLVKEGGDYETYAPIVLRAALGVASRKELDTDNRKAAAWANMLTDFEMRSYAR